jgi:hypothetical protein
VKTSHPDNLSHGVGVVICDHDVAEGRCEVRMLAQVKDFVDVAARARSFGCRVPVRIALLPGNFSAASNACEFSYHAATAHVRSAWRSVGLEDEGPQTQDMAETGIRDSGPGNSSGIRMPVAGSRPLTTIPPDSIPGGCIVSQAKVNNEGANVPLAAFFGTNLLGGPAWCLTVALGMVSLVLISHPSCANPREVRFDIVVERPNGGCACLEYDGDAYELVSLAKEVRGIWTGR